MYASWLNQYQILQKMWVFLGSQYLDAVLLVCQCDVIIFQIKSSAI